MNITFFIGGLSGGGAERVVCNLSNFLSENHNVTILTLSDDEPISKLNKDIKRVCLVRNAHKTNFLTRNFKRLLRLRKYIKKSDADIYVVMLPSTINLLLLNRKIIKAPVIVSERADPNTRYETSRFKRWVMQKLYPKADGFVFQTEDAMNYYQPIISDNRIVIPNAINEEFVRSIYTGFRRKAIVSAGRLTNQKNFTMLIKAYSNIINKHPDYDLEIYGEGPLKGELQKSVNDLNLNQRVKFQGYVNDFGSKIIDSSLFVLSSNYEGMPNVLIEAMALGLPCISTNCPVGGPKFLIEDGNNGFLVPVGDVKELEIAMDKILSNETRAREMGQKATEIVDRLAPEKIYKKWENYLEKFYLNY